MTIEERDILTIKRGIICHQCNCIGVMGAGLAKDIKDKWPHVYDDYKQAIRARELELGKCRLAQAEPGIFLAHLAGQYNVGKGKQTDYAAFRNALLDLRRQINGSYVLMRMPIYFPHGIGCGHGGGNWKIVFEILKSEFPEATICKKG